MLRDDEINKIVSIVDSIQPYSREPVLQQKISNWSVTSNREERQNEDIDVMLELIDKILNGDDRD